MSCLTVSTAHAQKNISATRAGLVKLRPEGPLCCDKGLVRPVSAHPLNYYLLTIGVGALALVLAACGTANPPTTGAASTELPAPIQVTPTTSPPVALVNGEAIPGDIYQIHLAQYRAAQGESGTLLASEDAEQIVLDDLIDRLLLAQGAREAGLSLDDATIDQRLSAVVEQAGGQEAFDAWLGEQGYTADQFRSELSLEIEAGWMRSQITEAVPLSAEQVEARQILFTDSFQAERSLDHLEGGTPFEQEAANNDPQGLGSLGWFPRGYLMQPEVEEAAFALQPGEFSQVIETELGFHLIEVLDRDPDRPLSPQARLALQMKALEEWVEAQRAQSTIETLLR
ncbi:MAG TPA: SurA N-terminal domain-containing protein [Anaerolineales bacterium]|nr:SurA N-terminal domain-containing protein [Anaerolineales bacterium]